MPMSAAFFNYLIPLMIGARDVAFPRLNALSFWVFLLGALFLNSSWFLGRRAGRRLVRRTAELDDRPRQRDDVLRARPADHRHRLDRRRDQPGVTVINMRAPGHVAVPDAGVRVDGPGRAVPAGVLAADHHGRAVPAAVRPAVGHRVLRSDARRRADPVAAHVLAVRAPGGLHPDPARVRHHQRDPAGVQPQAAVRLPVRRVLAGSRSGSSGSACGSHHMFAAGLGPVANTAFGITDRDHRDPHRREDLQLDGHDVRRATCSSTRRCCSPSARWRCS